MVHNAAGDPPWPRPSPRTLHLLRRGAELALDPPAAWIDELHAASLGGARMRPAAEDPALAEGIRRANVANLRHWAAANIARPGERVPANTGPEPLEAGRDLVRRGLDEGALDAFRAGQNVAWRHWMNVCFGLTSDPDELRALLDVSALSINAFIDDTISALSERMRAEREELTRGTHAERRAAVTLLLEGAPIGRDRAESRLRHPLSGPHTAAIVRGDPGTTPDHLEAAAEAVARAGGADHRLTVIAGATVLWVWLPIATAPPRERLAAELTAHPRVRVAVGRPGKGVDGFRRSHFDAAATQRMLAGAPSRRFARYEDVQLAALFADAAPGVEEFLHDTLGELMTADAALRETALTYIRSLGNTTLTAERSYTHRNTVVRRLNRVDELLPRPLDENPVDVAVALELLRWHSVS
ncbi:PucR family transcriptional regulator [Nocardiopsis lambiniae]|uniref:Helix-turn-helix domain-containing protein n=1 Tax=Nocardiopsis lambiniae TaxID=3075539 RepID=A0ABU2MB07_9ACTN|nr:helix-turn-helix domain-containing protein [Nocardiopsis sp. DSM 44743]MDT0329426.1 helix-turn-helix domain-containing protein [Nocardiopsis sp. DSM 44743]